VAPKPADMGFMPGEPVRSLRHAAIVVAALGALSLLVPMSLLLSSNGLFPVLHPGSHTVDASAFDDTGRQLARPARLRPGAVAEVVAPGFAAAEPVVVRQSGSPEPVATGWADEHGVFRYRFTVPPLLSGAQSLTLLGSLDRPGQSGGGPETAVFRFFVSADQAGDR
jgi:hypothetical protein